MGNRLGRRRSNSAKRQAWRRSLAHCTHLDFGCGLNQGQGQLSYEYTVQSMLYMAEACAYVCILH